MDLVSIDHVGFHFINATFTNPIFDVVFPFVTDLQKNLLVVAPAIVLLVAALIYYYRVQGARIALAFAVVLGVTDFVNYHVIKAVAQRDRPEFAGLHPVLRTHSHSGTSFPSNHAANVTAAAVFLGYWFRRARYLFYLYAFLVAYSRVYVGVHFPLDVIGGALFGSTVARGIQIIYKNIEIRYFVKKVPIELGPAV